MALVKDYKSNIFRSMPDNTGHLAIHITEQRCTIAVCSSTGVLTFLRSITRPKEVYIHDFVQNIFEKYVSFFKKKFATTTIGASTSNFTILPNSESLNEDDVISYLTGSPTRISFTDTIEHLDAKFIYSIPKALHSVLEKKLTDYSLVSSTRLSIEKAMVQQVDSVLVFEDSHFDCITFKDGQLFSVNRHFFESPEDIVYFVGLSLKDADISPETAKITATGTIKKHSPEFNLLYRYFQVIQLQHIQTNIIVHPDFGTPQHSFQSILNILDENY